MENMEYKGGFHPIYALAVLYVISVYSFPFLFFSANDKLAAATYEGEVAPQYWPFLVPVIFGIANVVVVNLVKNRLHRLYFLNCALLIKYSLIPFYLVGGLCIVIALLLIFTPVVIMVFVGPAVAVSFSVIGWLALAFGSPYSLTYIIKSARAGVHGKVLSAIAAVLQFVFTADVISIMVLSIKEGRGRKLVAAVMLLLVVAMIASVIWLVAAVIS